MSEAVLALPVANWMESQGYTVYAEIPMMYRCVDLIGKNDDGELMAVELKTSLTEKLRHQVQCLDLFAERVYCGIGTSPKQASLQWCKKRGVGILTVSNGSATEVLPSQCRIDVLPHYVKKCLEGLSDAIPGCNAGKPSLLGEGPAQDVKRAIEDYRKEHPSVTWKELYLEIPNHYSSYQSMYGGMRMVSIRKRLRRKAHERSDNQVGGFILHRHEGSCMPKFKVQE